MSSTDEFDQHAEDAGEANKALRRKLAADSDESDFKWLMGSKRGRRIVWRLLDEAAVFRTTFNADATVMAFAEGKKNAGYKTLAKIHTLCPELYSTMTKEAIHDNRSTGD